MIIAEIIGYIGALFIGLSMGMMGGGGSILSVPIFAYLFGFDEKVATAYSLFVVGTTAFVGGVRKIFSDSVSFKCVWMFGLPAIVGVLVMRRFVMPALPEELFHIGDFEFTRRMLVFSLFSFLMFLSSYSILFKTTNHFENSKNESPKFHPLILTEGLFTGIFMGLIGAGGGFLIVPALMFIAKLPIKSAVATSLVIVCMNSLVGFFLGDFIHLHIDWTFLLSFVSISLVGIVIGGSLAVYVKSQILKKYFAYFTLGMAIFVIFMEFFVIHADIF